MLSSKKPGICRADIRPSHRLIQRAGTDILKVQEFYLGQSGKEALLESIAIEQGVACNFFVQLKLHEKAITVRLLPATDPEKTPGVK